MIEQIYDEIMQRLSDEEKPILTAQIEKNLYDWATTFEGLIIKSERDTFVLLLQQKYLKQLEENKFNILDKMKEINSPGKSSVNTKHSNSYRRRFKL